MVIALEQVEALWVISDYGNLDILILSKTRAIYPVDVIIGVKEYPEMDDLKKIIDHAGDARFINATELALKVKTPILVNIIMLNVFFQWEIDITTGA